MSEISKRNYKDADGQPISLYRLIRNEPAWAENQILHRDKLDAELAEARAEIERLKNKNTASISAHMWLIMRHAFTSGAYKGYAHGTEKKLLAQMFTEWCNKDYPEAAEKEIERLTEIERKDKLIEQMREALKSAKNTADIRNIELIKAALSAAERGG